MVYVGRWKSAPANRQCMQSALNFWYILRISRARIHQQPTNSHRTNASTSRSLARLYSAASDTFAFGLCRFHTQCICVYFMRDLNYRFSILALLQFIYSSAAWGFDLNGNVSRWVQIIFCMLIGCSNNKRALTLHLKRSLFSVGTIGTFGQQQKNKANKQKMELK